MKTFLRHELIKYIESAQVAAVGAVQEASAAEVF